MAEQTYPEGYLAAGRYQVLRLIGSGAMGEVYEAFDTKIEKQIALKFLCQRMADNQALRKRFEREAKAAGRIGHDNVCDVSDWGVTDDGVPFLVMELLQGESLADRLARDGQIPLDETVAIMLQVLSALKAAHDRGIVHRDLKPANIFLHRPSQDTERVKLVDFGIAKFMDGTGTGTEYGTVMGTLLYMSPEQANGDTSGIDHRTDIWAVGVIMYLMLSGKHPFMRRKAGEVIAAILGYSPPPLTELDPTIPLAMSEAVARVIHKDPEQRYAASDELAEAIRAASQVQPTKMLPPIIDSSVSIGELPPTLSDRTVPPAATTAPVGRDGSLRWIVVAIGVLVVACLVAGAMIFVLMGLRDEAALVSGRDRQPVARTEPPQSAAESPVTSSVGANAEVLSNQGASPGADPSEEPPAPRPMVMEVLGVPEGASLLFDGQPVTDGRIAGEPGRSGFLQVSAEGYDSLALRVLFERSGTIDLSQRLRRTTPEPTPAQPPALQAARPRPPPSPAGRANPQSRAPAGSRGNKISVIRDYPE